MREDLTESVPRSSLFAKKNPLRLDFHSESISSYPSSCSTISRFHRQDGRQFHRVNKRKGEKRRRMITSSWKMSATVSRWEEAA